MTISGVTVLCDVLRPDGRGRPGGADRMALWLHCAIRRQIALASGLETDLLSPSASTALALWVAGLRAPAEADALWAACFACWPDDAAWTDAAERLILRRLRGRFCVGYELPPALAALLDRHAIPYLDIRIHPVRFLDDLMFAVRASAPETRDALCRIAVPEAEAIATAGLHEAACRLAADATMPSGALLVLGQRRFDATQIAGGRFFDAEERRTDIATLTARYATIVLKPHPLDREHSLLTVAASVGRPVFGVVKDNLYGLLAMPEIAAVLTASSSAAHEAPYFGKTVHTLMEPALRLSWRGEVAPADRHVAIDGTLLSVDFWRLVLTPHAVTTPFDGTRLPPKPNRLRIALDSFWNYNEIDTDRIPRGAAAMCG